MRTWVLCSIVVGAMAAPFLGGCCLPMMLPRPAVGPPTRAIRPAQRPAGESIPSRPVAQAPTPLLATGDARALGDAINTARQRAALPPFQGEATLQQEAEHAAAAYAAAVRANASDPQTPPELDGKRLQGVLPGAAEIAYQASAADTTDEVAQRAAQWDLVKRKDLTHLGVGLATGTLESGQSFTAVVALAAQLCPTMDEDLLNQGQRDFHLTCFLCGHQFLGRMSQPAQENRGSLYASCPQCGRTFDVFGIDRQRQYHRPPWFLRGYQPEEVSDPLAAWLFVLTNCRYVGDMKQFGYREVWQLGEETYQTRQGDCEDLAILLADWLEAAGFEARVVLGDTDGSGHAWVVWRQDGQEYLLEATGGRGNYRRVPPRTEFATDYQPQVQFDRAGVWFRTSGKWTGEYYEGGEWSRAPGPAGSRPTSNG